MNLLILEILLSIILGIILGLYFKNIALFIFILVIFLYFAVKLKKDFKIIDRKIFLIFLSIIIFIFVCIKEEKYNNLYKENINLSGIGEIVSFAEEKEYKNKYILKIKQINKDFKFKNTKLILYLDKEIKLEYGDIIYFENSNFERVFGTRNDKCFNYERYLRQSKIYGILNLEDFKIISKNQGIKYHFFKFKNELNQKLYEIFDYEKASFLAGLLIR